MKAFVNIYEIPIETPGRIASISRPQGGECLLVFFHLHNFYIASGVGNRCFSMKFVFYCIGLPTLFYCFYTLYNDIFLVVYAGKEIGGHFRDLGPMFHVRLLIGFAIGWFFTLFAERFEGKVIYREPVPKKEKKRKKKKKKEKEKEKEEEEAKEEKEEQEEEKEEEKNDDDGDDTNRKLEAELKRLQEEKKKLEEELKKSGKGLSEEEQIQKLTE